ncbi:MAG: helix-turn-helix domain-containing protein [Jatrophihabitans sp.]
MNAGRLLRAVRRARVLSQRELARYAGVPPSTIDRIECGRTEPRLSTFVAILRSVDFDLTLVDQWGRALDLDDEHDKLRDRAFRRFPSHLPAHPVGAPYRGVWWGWGRIAWQPSDKTVPTHTYWLRTKPPPGGFADPWYNDAT